MIYTVEETHERTDGDWDVIKITRTVRIFGIRVSRVISLHYPGRR